jgi:hypothetical protein
MIELRKLAMIGALVCAWSAARADPAAPDAPAAEAILKGEAPAGDYSQAAKCLPSVDIERTEALSERYIVFHFRNDGLWLAQMRGRCPGMSPNSHLAFEKDKSRLCEWDTVRVVYDEGIGNVRLGPICNLPKFEPVSPEQVEMLRQQIRNPTKVPGEQKP